jgi:hypothetical protein
MKSEIIPFIPLLNRNQLLGYFGPLYQLLRSLLETIKRETLSSASVDVHHPRSHALWDTAALTARREIDFNHLLIIIIN